MAPEGPGERGARRPAKPLLVALPGALGWLILGLVFAASDVEFLRGFPAGATLAAVAVGSFVAPVSLLCLVLASLRPRARWAALLTNGSFLLLVLYVLLGGVR